MARRVWMDAFVEALDLVFLDGGLVPVVPALLREPLEAIVIQMKKCSVTKKHVNIQLVILLCHILDCLCLVIILGPLH